MWISLNQFLCSCSPQDVWYGRGPRWWWLRRGGERGGILDWGGGEDAAASCCPQRGQCVGQPQGQVWLHGLRGGSHPLEPMCRRSQCSAPGCGLLCGAAACSAAALCWFPLPFKGELSAQKWTPLNRCYLCLFILVGARTSWEDKLL